MFVGGAGGKALGTEIGYTLMSEHAGPRQLVRHAVAAENAGFVADAIPCGDDVEAVARRRGRGRTPVSPTSRCCRSAATRRKRPSPGRKELLPALRAVLR